MNPNTVLVNAPDAVAIRYVENRRNDRAPIAQYTPTTTSSRIPSVREPSGTQNCPESVRTGGSDTTVTGMADPRRCQGKDRTVRRTRRRRQLDFTNPGAGPLRPAPGPVVQGSSASRTRVSR